MLKKCLAISNDLRTSIQRWDSTDPRLNSKSLKATAGTLGAEAAEEGKLVEGEGEGEGEAEDVEGDDEEGECVALLEMRPASHSSPSSSSSSSAVVSSTAAASIDEVLSEQAIVAHCPGLQLKSYQTVGVNWLYLLHKHSVNGVLADDMGLGMRCDAMVFRSFLIFFTFFFPRFVVHLVFI